MEWLNKRARSDDSIDLEKYIKYLNGPYNNFKETLKDYFDWNYT